jgi:hypothetical protein
VSSEEQRLLRERLSLRGIGPARGVGQQGRLPVRGAGVQAAPPHLSAEPPGGPPPGSVPRLETALAEPWSFGGKEATRHRGWRARDAAPRRALACQGGDRGGQSAPGVWEKVPAGDQEHAGV